MLRSPQSVTGQWLAERPDVAGSNRQATDTIQLKGVRHHNLHDVDVQIPLGMLCVVTGVSGSGKSSLIHETLFPAACGALGIGHSIEAPGLFDSITGCEHIAGAVMVDQKPVGRSKRSNPVTYLKAFDDIRKIFALTAESKLRNFTPSTFSFNSKAVSYTHLTLPTICSV